MNCYYIKPFDLTPTTVRKDKEEQRKPQKINNVFTDRNENQN